MRRDCFTCGARLARDNSETECSPCARARKSQLYSAPHLNDRFWRDDHMSAALATRDMSQVVVAYRHHPMHGKPLRQSDVAEWLDITQSQLSRIESGRNRIRDLDKLVHYARRLRIPAELLWFHVDSVG